MKRDVIVKLSGVGGASFPNDPVEGRFTLRGTIVEGPKSMLGRYVIVEMTHETTKSVVNNLASALLRYPKCGTQPKQED